jgi:hypothetical protein
MLARPDGTRDTTTRVRWLQGLRAFIDLRRPALMNDFSHVRCLADLTMDDCAGLATQQGFAGRLTFDGTHFEWVRSIDFQPKSLELDAGSLRWEGDVLVEKGRDIDYVEHWHRDEAAATQPTAAIEICDKSHGAKGALLRVGNLFMFARDRAVTMPAHQTMSECVSAAPTLQHAQALLDFEISFGARSAEGFRITESSLPYRVGDILGQRFANNAVSTMDRAANGDAVTRHWDIIETEGDAGALQLSAR